MVPEARYVLQIRDLKFSVELQLTKFKIVGCLSRLDIVVCLHLVCQSLTKLVSCHDTRPE